MDYKYYEKKINDIILKCPIEAGVEIPNIALSETGQVQGQKTAARHYLYTNGLVWKYFKDGRCEWECSLAYFESKECEKITIFHPVSINKGDFTELKNRLNEIKWKMV